MKLPQAGVADPIPGGRPAFRVVIAYEDFAAAKRAMDACKILLPQLGSAVEFRSGMWKFDLLRNAKLNQIAASDALDADLIIVATSQNADLPVEVKKWIEMWTARKRSRAAALVALLDFTGEDVSGFSLAHDYLRKAAATAEMNFMSHSMDLAGSGSPVPAGHAYDSRTRLTSDRIVGRPAPEGWGLND